MNAIVSLVLRVKVWQIEDSARAVQFDVVSSPNDWTRGVSRDTRRAANQELSEKQQKQLRYWTGLFEYMVEKGSPFNCPSPRPWRYHELSIGRNRLQHNDLDGKFSRRNRYLALHQWG